MRTIASSVVAGLSLLLLGVGSAAAQAPGIDIKLNPRIGLYQPLSDLTHADDAAATISSELEGSLALGLGVEISSLLPVGIRFNLDYATGSQVSYDNGFETRDDGETTVLTLVGDLMFRPLPTLLIAQPYFFAGGGIKQYDFEFDEQPSLDSFDPSGLFQDGSDLTVHVGGGLDVGVGPLALNAEVGDYISWWEIQGAATGENDTEIQHDLFVTIGFAIGLL